MRKDGELKYRNCIISYSVYGEGKKFTGSACISINYGSHTDDHPLFLDKPYETIGLAEEAIIGLSKKRIDG